mmetsp:Transcript_43062/g.85296  ORF Transcript_43062/g.85296 Transcript_43062/m.85296 type:complete len:91 (+) Transcript_43062:281-553(+)
MVLEMAKHASLLGVHTVILEKHAMLLCATPEAVSQAMLLGTLEVASCVQQFAAAFEAVLCTQPAADPWLVALRAGLLCGELEIAAHAYLS